MMLPYRSTSAGLIVAALVTSAAAQGPAPSPAGFALKHEVSIDAPPARVYQALTTQVGSWWGPTHTYSGDAKNMTIDARPGGCFCETLANGGGIEHGRVLWAAPGQALRLQASLGPLQESGLVGSLTFLLTTAPGGTRVVMTYSVGGFIEGGFDKVAPIVSNVLREQLLRFEAFVETGKPDPAPAR